MGDTTFTDKRSNNKPSKFTNEDRQLIHQHINSIPRDDSHYSRAKSDKQFLSPDLNIHRLYKSFLQKNKTSTVSYKFYRGVFKKDFPNLSFHRPRVDTCHTCDRLSCESKQNNSAGIKASIQLDIHHRKVQKSMEHVLPVPIILLQSENTFLSDSNRAFMCMWHEGVSGRDGNEIASTLLKILNSGITEKKHLLLWSDNLCGAK
nr:unnamed protein product [Callosobruchus chinensis]